MSRDEAIINKRIEENDPRAICVRCDEKLKPGKYIWSKTKQGFYVCLCNKCTKVEGAVR